MSIGVDYAWSHPSPAALRAAHIVFAMRYLSNDPKKNLSKAEASSLAAAGIWCGVVWESTASRAGAGKAAGAADARTALAQATAAGMPSGRPVYLAVDYDADPATVAPYFEGAASVLGVARTGVYGGYRVVKYLLDHGLVRWAWQTRAWSGGQWDSRAHIRQGAYVTIGGVQCDANTSEQDDFGQWMPGKTPEDDVALTDAQTKALAMLPQIASDTAALRKNLLHIGSLTEKDAKGAPVEHAAGYYLAHAAADAGEAASSAAPTLTDAQVAALGQQLAANPVLVAAFADAVAANLANRLES